MNRALTPKLIVLCLTLAGVLFESRTYAWAISGDASVAVEPG